MGATMNNVTRHDMPLARAAQIGRLMNDLAALLQVEIASSDRPDHIRAAFIDEFMRLLDAKGPKP
jgi:hypothetical protein